MTTVVRLGLQTLSEKQTSCRCRSTIHPVYMADVVRCMHACFAVLCSQQLKGVLQRNGVGSTCTVRMTVHKTMKAPVFLYYELDKFYQNHRRYVRCWCRIVTQPLAECQDTTCSCACGVLYVSA